MPGVPRSTWAFNSDYYFPLGNAWSGHFGADYRWVGQRMSGFNSSSHTYNEGSYGVLGLNADFTRDIWTVRVYAKNLTNQQPSLNIDYLQNAANGKTVGLLSSSLQPRTVGVELDVQF